MGNLAIKPSPYFAASGVSNSTGGCSYVGSSRYRNQLDNSLLTSAIWTLHQHPSWGTNSLVCYAQTNDGVIAYASGGSWMYKSTDLHVWNQLAGVVNPHYTYSVAASDDGQQMMTGSNSSGTYAYSVDGGTTFQTKNKPATGNHYPFYWAGRFWVLHVGVPYYKISPSDASWTAADFGFLIGAVARSGNLLVVAGGTTFGIATEFDGLPFPIVGNLGFSISGIAINDKHKLILITGTGLQCVVLNFQGVIVVPEGTFSLPDSNTYRGLVGYDDYWITKASNGTVAGFWACHVISCSNPTIGWSYYNSPSYPYPVYAVLNKTLCTISGSGGSNGILMTANVLSNDILVQE